MPKQFPDDNLVYRPRVHTGFGQYRTKSLHGTNKLVLTYDDGPHISYTPKILDLLGMYGVKATFFVLTKNINPQNRHIIDRIILEGHTLASHDHDHDNNNNESETTYREELTKTINDIQYIFAEFGVDNTPIFYRFPYGAYGTNGAYHHMNIMKEVSNDLFGENCINFAFWDIDTADWVGNMTSQDVADGVKGHMLGGYGFTHTKENGRWVKKAYKISNPPKGGVVLMHDVQKKTIKGTEILLGMANEHAWEIVPLESAPEFSFEDKTCTFKK